METAHINIRNLTPFSSPPPDKKASTSSTKYWAPSSKGSSYFRQINGTASDAIVDLCSSQTYGECLGALFACIWYGAQCGMGEDFNGLYPGPMALDMDSKQNDSCQRNLRSVTNFNAKPIPGDKVYFQNDN